MALKAYGLLVQANLGHLDRLRLTGLRHRTLPLWDFDTRFLSPTVGLR